MMGKSVKEYCGLCGMFNIKEASLYVFLSLYALQHRGEESCGIVSYTGEEFFIHRGMGLVSEVFNDEILKQLPGRCAIGHVRYSTTGSSRIKNAQPLFAEAMGIAVAHNGNLVNSLELREQLKKEGMFFHTSSDSEIILQLIMHSREEKFLDKLFATLKKIQGAYSLVIMTPHEIIGVRDPQGFRPLCIGQKEDALCLVSESCALDLIEAEFVREVEPGEVVFLSKEGIKSFFPQGQSKKRAFCIFEHVYFSRPDSFVFGDHVYSVRERLGRALAREHPVDADLVVPVPDSGTFAALGYSYESGIPLEMAVIRNHYVGRTFIQPHQDIRDLGVKVKFNILRNAVKGKRVVIVDDSIVRGTTSKKRVRQFRDLGAKEIHLRISCPPHKFGCFYGIDFPDSSKLIASGSGLRDIEKFLEVDSVGYLSLEGMLGCVAFPAENYCTACWSGEYPIKFSSADKYVLEKK